MLDQEVARLKGIIEQISSRVRYAVHVQYSLDDEEQRTLTQLEMENAQLRQLLCIAEEENNNKLTTSSCLLNNREMTGMHEEDQLIFTSLSSSASLSTTSLSSLTTTPVYLNVSMPSIANPDKPGNQENST
jgi:hypothetical protein